MDVEQDNIDIVTSLVVSENADNSDNVDNDTIASGFFIKPSVVAGRPTDITNYITTAQDEYGKVVFEEQDFGLELSPRADVTQVGTINSSVAVDGRHGKITTVDTMSINTGGFEEFLVSNEYVSEDSIVLLSAEIDSPAEHLFANAVDITGSTFTVRLNNYYSVTFTGIAVKINYAIL